jgi:hypothetical protein
MNEMTAVTDAMPTVELEAPRAGFANRARGLGQRVWFDLAYLGAIGLTSVVAFCIWVGALSITLSLLVFVVGLFAWFATVYLARWTTVVDRRLAGWARGEPVAAVYRRTRSRSFWRRLRNVTIDPQTWKDLGWLVLNSILGFTAAVVGLTATAVVLAYIVMPLWWWAIPGPSQQYGTLEMGIYTVHNTGTALVNTGIGLLLTPLALLLNRGLVGRGAGPAPLPRPADRDPLPVCGAPVRQRAAEWRRGRDRLPAEGPGRRPARVRRGARAGRRDEAWRSIRRRSRSCSATTKAGSGCWRRASARCWR